MNRKSLPPHRTPHPVPYNGKGEPQRVQRENPRVAGEVTHAAAEGDTLPDQIRILLEIQMVAVMPKIARYHYELHNPVRLLVISWILKH